MTSRAHRRMTALAMAGDLGVGDKTVSRARKTTAPHGAVGKRTGGRAKARSAALLNDPADHGWPPEFLTRRIFVR
jgi:hypothetical protein